MKLKIFQLEKTLSSLKGILIYGTDTGSITQSAQTVLKKLGVLGDEFAVIKIDTDTLKENPSAFTDELNSIGLFSSSRVIWFKNPTDSFINDAQDFIDTYNGDTFVLMTSDSLNTKSKLVKAFDSGTTVGSLGCYPLNAGDVRGLVQTNLSDAHLTISPDALSLLCSYLETDRGIITSELAKLILYMGDKTTVSTQDIINAIGNGSSVNMDDLIYAVFSGKHTEVQRIFELMLAEGNQVVQITRAFILKINTLLIVLSKIKQGATPESAIKSTPPFIPFKYEGIWRSVVTRWSEKEAKKALSMLLEAERDCKTGLPAEVICNRVLTSLTNAGKKLIR